MAAKRKAAKKKAATTTTRRGPIEAGERVRHEALGKGTVQEIAGDDASVRFHRAKGKWSTKTVNVAELSRA